MPNPQDGFATPAAVLISLAIATIAIAVQLRAVAALHLAETDLQRSQAERLLDGVQAFADERLQDGRGDDPAPRSIDLDGEPVSITAEPEAPKLSLAAAAQLDDEALSALGASHLATVRSGLVALAATPRPDPQAVSSLDPAAAWRRCSRSAVSPYGAALVLAPASRSPGASLFASGHAGEVWRIEASTAAGWTDDRIVRLVGRKDASTRTLDRSFYRRPPGDLRCAG